VIVGRTSAMGITGAEDTIARMRAYEAAGVDAIFLNGVGDQLDAITGIVKLPLILGAAGRAGTDLATMASHGVRIANQGHAPFMSAMAAAREMLKAMHDGTPPSREANRALQAMMKTAARDPAYAAWSKDFMGG
jgi:carboxyvinyl-carboxyphosphonate phosphorylmutase